MISAFFKIILTATLATAEPALPAPITTDEHLLFPVDQALEPRIAFWSYIFGELDSDSYLLHDLRYPEITYYTVPFPRIAEESPQQTWKRAKEFGERHKNELRAIITAYNNGDKEALKRLPDDKARDNFLKLQEKFPEQMSLAHERIGIQHGVADKFKEAVINCQEKYRPAIEEILTAENVPTELYWLVFVESMCVPGSGSHAGAAGIWQLMPGAARDFNLTVNSQRDDRFDINKSTHAAAKLFKRGQKKLSSWPLTITGYNHGDSGIKKLTEKYNSTDLAYLIENINYREESTFGFASMNFYAEFITVQRLGTELLQKNEVSNEQNQQKTN